MPRISLLVLRSANVEATLSFWRALGFDFVQEQHGAGPLHFSSENGGFVLEIYPGEIGQPIPSKTSGAAMVGVEVESLEAALEILAKSGVVPSVGPKDAPWGKWANVSDPDGRTVQIIEPPK